MIIVKVKNNNIDQAIKQLRRKVRNIKQINSLRDRKEYTKPSIIKRLKKQKAKYVQSIKSKEQ